MSKGSRSLRKLTLAAVLIALTIVLTRFLSVNISVFRFGFGMLPVHYAGFLLGPLWGGAVGAISDLIGLLFNTVGAPHPGITLTTALHGIIPGLMVMVNQRRLNPLTIMLSGVLTSILLSLLLQSLWLSQLLGQGFVLLLQARSINVLLQGLVLILAESMLLPVIFSVRRYLPTTAEIRWRWQKYDKISEQTHKGKR